MWGEQVIIRSDECYEYNGWNEVERNVWTNVIVSSFVHFVAIWFFTWNNVNEKFVDFQIELIEFEYMVTHFE